LDIQKQCFDIHSDLKTIRNSAVDASMAVKVTSLGFIVNHALRKNDENFENRRFPSFLARKTDDGGKHPGINTAKR
jgi:hypothetical protein